jgi:hypothetical protein
MKSFPSCLSVILTLMVLLVTTFFVAQTIPARLRGDFPTATPVWATFPSSAVTPYVTEAIYQTFEHGFMLWRADYNCVYAIVADFSSSPHYAIIPDGIPTYPGEMIHSYGYCLSVAPLTDQALDAEPSTGSLEPTGVLGLIWRYYGEIRSRLCAPTAPERRYTANVPTNEGAAIMDGSPFTMAQLTLPDGTIFACGSRAATAGTC